MEATFDPADRNRWYFGQMSRQEATDLLMSEKEGGMFLVRDSSSKRGNFVLSVWEDCKVSHYIINALDGGQQSVYVIGEESFDDLGSLLNFYMVHFLRSTPLTRPAPRRQQQVVCLFNFDGGDSDDLPFKKGEVLTVISKEEDQWWTARNSLGQTGSIPVPYVQTYEQNRGSVVSNRSSVMTDPGSTSGARYSTVEPHRQLPAYARANKDYIPSPYDATALPLKRGDVLLVTKRSLHGLWEGVLDGRRGHFPFIHVDFLQEHAEERWG